MFWADKIAKDIIDSGKYKPYWVDDMKTPSGFAHVGSLMGPVIHSMIYRALKDAGKEVTFTFVINDFDPADDLLPEIRGTHEKYLGMPLKLAPSPDPSFTSMADLFGDDFIRSIKSVGVEAEILSSWELYHAGKFDGVIKEALDNAEKIQDIYQRVSGSKKKEAGWLPFQVICENCSKLGTTKVFAWDGEKVSYRCEPHLVKWAIGCGHEGKVSPYGGSGKLPWKVDWAAHWKVLGITIEGAGKDHASKGGSYDIAMTICKEIFNYESPFRLPYEFILIGGKKMSSSKGLGLKAHDLVTILPPSVARFLFARNGIKSQTNFDPNDPHAIPMLFDDFLKAAEEYTTHQNTDAARAFELSILEEKTYPPIKFSTLAQWVQMPNMEKKIKEEGLEEWAKYARIWLEKFAPEGEKFIIQKEIPESTQMLSSKQREFLKIVSEKLTTSWDPEDLQKEIFEWGKSIDIPSKDAFAAIYTALLGKNHGPKAAFLIASLDKDFVRKRFIDAAKTEVSSINQEVKEIQQLKKPEIFSIDKKIYDVFPSVSVGVAIIKNVRIEKTNEQLEKKKEGVLISLENVTTEQLGQYPEIISYRKLYKEMGVDWHSRRPSPEALLRRVALKKGLYTVNTCVDAYNLVVMKHRVSVGAFDLDTLKMPTVLRFPKSGEEILLLGDTEPTKYTEKELAYFDENGGFNIDFNYRDAQKTAVQLHTKNIYINVDGIYDVTPQKVAEVLKETCDSIMKYCGGTLEEFGVEVAS